MSAGLAVLRHLQEAKEKKKRKKHWKEMGGKKGKGKKILIFKNSLVLKSLRPAGEANKF